MWSAWPTVPRCPVCWTASIHAEVGGIITWSSTSISSPRWYSPERESHLRMGRLLGKSEGTGRICSPQRIKLVLVKQENETSNLGSKLLVRRLSYVDYYFIACCCLLFIGVFCCAFFLVFSPGSR